jgi:hypothetical protein
LRRRQAHFGGLSATFFLVPQNFFSAHEFRKNVLKAQLQGVERSIQKRREYEVAGTAPMLGAMKSRTSIRVQRKSRAIAAVFA